MDLYPLNYFGGIMALLKSMSLPGEKGLQPAMNPPPMPEVKPVTNNSGSNTFTWNIAYDSPDVPDWYYVNADDFDNVSFVDDTMSFETKKSGYSVHFLDDLDKRLGNHQYPYHMFDDDQLADIFIHFSEKKYPNESVVLNYDKKHNALQFIDINHEGCNEMEYHLMSGVTTDKIDAWIRALLAIRLNTPEQ